MSWILLSPAVVNAQNDTLLVQWVVDDELAVNALYNAIIADTVAGGERANPNRVYKLEQGGFYYNTERIENNGWHLRIVGEAGDPNDEFANPPMIQLEHREDGGRADKILTAGGSVTLKNVIINGKTTLGDLPYEIVRFNAANADYHIDNVIFEFAGWGIVAFYGRNSNIHITNSTFRNLLSLDQPWGGRGLSIWTDVNEVFIENNTFMNIGGFAVQLEGGTAEQFWFNHNTVVNNGRQVLLHSQYKEAYIANNLIVNGFWQGEGSEGFDPVRLATPDLQFAGMMTVTTLPSAVGLDIERIIVFANNSFHRDQVYQDYYNSTSGADFPIRPQPVFNERTTNLMAEYDNMIAVNTIENQNPGLVNAPDNPQEQIAFISAIRAGESAATWYWDPGRDLNEHYSIQWPLPEDFSYSNTTLRTAATGGFPLGDLNWYPAQKADWMTQREALSEEIKSIAGPAPEVTLVASWEAEEATVTGTEDQIEIVEAPDLQIAEMKGAGFIEWTTSIAEAGNYSFSIRTRVPFSTGVDRAQKLVVNGVEVTQFPIGNEGNEWTDIVIEDVALNAGDNVIRLEPSWGYQDFESVTISGGSGTVAYLRASQATLDSIALVCGGDMCASGDEYVEFKTGGSIGFDYTSDGIGEYVLRITYMLIDGEKNQDVYLNGSLLQSVDFAGADSAWIDADVTGLMLNAGANVIEIRSGSGAMLVDYATLFKIGTVTSIGNTERPDGFVLSQNYPNPFNPTTQINFTLPQTQDVRLTVYNVLGQRVALLADGLFTEGRHSVQFNARDLSSGVYIYRIESGSFVQSRKMILIK
jgi:hypothetical protein